MTQSSFEEESDGYSQYYTGTSVANILNMRIVIFTWLLIGQTVLVNCFVGEYIKSKYYSFTNYVKKSFDNIGAKLKRIFYPTTTTTSRPVETQPVFIDRPIHKDLIDAFKVYVKSEALNEDIHGSGKKQDIPALLLATPQMAYWHGRDMESHVVQSKDGYFLTIHRLVASPNLQANRTVLLHHGLFGSSTDWILLGPTKSLPYILADAGYDVWFTNARGNYYSRGHLSKQLDCKDYWNFSWQEMGEFDLPAVIDYIRTKKNITESINFVGHSMGATALLVMLASKPQYNAYLRVGVLLAPLAYMSNITGPMKVMTAMSEDTVRLLGNGEFLPQRKVPSWLATKYCKGPKVFCSNPLLFFSGFHHDWRWNASFISKLLYHIPAGVSTNTILHYMQVSHNGRFHRFDDPEVVFPLDQVTVPMAMISSSDDWLATVPDVLRLYFGLLNPIDHHIIQNMSMTHTDFVWGVDAHILVFERVVDYLEQGLQWRMENENEIE